MAVIVHRNVDIRITFLFNAIAQLICGMMSVDIYQGLFTLCYWRVNIKNKEEQWLHALCVYMSRWVIYVHRKIILLNIMSSYNYVA